MMVVEKRLLKRRGLVLNVWWPQALCQSSGFVKAAPEISPLSPRRGERLSPIPRADPSSTDTFYGFAAKTPCSTTLLFQCRHKDRGLCSRGSSTSISNAKSRSSACSCFVSYAGIVFPCRLKCLVGR